MGFKYSKKRAGLFGPVILMSHQVFSKIGGYYKVRKSVIEDVALGKVLNEAKIEYKLFVGEKDLSFKMYASFKDLFLGFTKNYASGANQSPPLILILTFLWITSITAIPLIVLESSIWFNQFNLLIALGDYSLVVIQLLWVAKAIGSFKKRYFIFYPILLLVFHVVFFLFNLCKVLQEKSNMKR